MAVDVTTATPLGEVERILTHRAERIAELERDASELEEHIFDLFNPPDDDSTTVRSVIDAAHTYIVAQPCTCKKDLIKRIYVPARDLRAGDVEHHYGCVENDDYDWADLDIEAVEIAAAGVEVTYRQTELWGMTIQRPFVFRDPERMVWVRRGPVEYEYDEACARCRTLGRLADEAVSR